jgi:hypothetical protein
MNKQDLQVIYEAAELTDKLSVNWYLDMSLAMSAKELQKMWEDYRCGMKSDEQPGLATDYSIEIGGNFAANVRAFRVAFPNALDEIEEATQ